jgi:hypothetical protein
MIADVPRFACPIEWCDGDLEQHGGDGNSPDAWVHADAQWRDLPGGARAGRYAHGGQSAEWSLVLDVEHFSSGTLGELAERLRAIATALEVIGIEGDVGTVV